MSDIQEEQKRLYKKAKENDKEQKVNKFNKLYNEYIEKPIITFDGKELLFTIKREQLLYILKYGKKLENKINKAIGYIELGLADEEEAEELLNILKGNN